jgi:hypothetical protein
MHGACRNGDAHAAAMPFAQTTCGIFVYLDLVVIKKRTISRPSHVQMGGLQAPATDDPAD